MSDVLHKDVDTMTLCELRRAMKHIAKAAMPTRFEDACSIVLRYKELEAELNKRVESGFYHIAQEWQNTYDRTETMMPRYFVATRIQEFLGEVLEIVLDEPNLENKTVEDLADIVLEKYDN